MRCSSGKKASCGVGVLVIYSIGPQEAQLRAV